MQWHYNGATEKYELWQDAEVEDKESGKTKIVLAPTVDRNTNEPLSFSNVIILFATYAQFSLSLHDIDLYVDEVPQAAILFRDGKIVYGTWQAPYKENPLIFNTMDGQLLPLKPGNTWIIIAGNKTITERIGPSEWDFTFGLP